MRLGSFAFVGVLALGFTATGPDLFGQCFYGGGNVVSGGNSGSPGNSSNGGTARGGSASSRGGGVTSTPAPSAGQPGGPATGGPTASSPVPGGPAVPATGPGTPGSGPRGRGGMALDLRRHEHSQKLLAMEWDYAAVLDAKKQAEGPTSSEARMQALSREEALKRLTGTDTRPMLILRECEGCAGSEVALFNRRMDSERTQLLAQFFHCVKFKPNVLADNHPYRQLFDAERPAHVVLLSADGETVIPYDGTQAQSELWKGMLAILKDQCERSADTAANQLSNLMNEYDVLDLELKGLKEELEGELESDGANSHRAGTLAEKVRKVEAKLKVLEVREARLLDLGAKRDLGVKKPAGATAKF